MGVAVGSGVGVGAGDAVGSGVEVAVGGEVDVASVHPRTTADTKKADTRRARTGVTADARWK